jgi:iron complex outermembrane receptor protein
LAAALAACSTIALAQVSAAPAAQSSEQQIQEIVVTAQKRSENIQRVPISIIALTSKSLDAAGVTDTRSLGAMVPGLTFNQNGASAIFTMRGVGTAVGTSGDEGAVNLIVDGVVYVSLPGSTLSLNNISQVEVLKGPQGTLFGRNASGGVINITTRNPSQHPELEMTAGYGNYNTLSGSLYATGGLGPNLAANIAVQGHDQQDGWGRNVTLNQRAGYDRDLSVRAKLLWTSDAGSEITLSGDYANGDGDTGNNRRILPGTIGFLGVVGQPFFYDTNSQYRDFTRTNAMWGVSLDAQQDLNWARLRSITAYRKISNNYTIDQDATPISIVDAEFFNREHQFSQELQLSSLAASQVKWIIGGYYLDANSAYLPLHIAGGAFAPLGGFEDLFGAIGTKSLAGFGQATVPVGDRLNLTGGLRYTSDKRTFQFHDTTGLGFGIKPVVDTSKTFDKLTFRVAADYRVSDDVLAYVSVNRGFKAGSFNVINPDNPAIRPETLTAYETGLKTTFFDNHFRFNFAGFYYDYTDLQVNQIVGADKGAGLLFILNAPKAKIYGVDIDFELHPVSRLTLSGGAELLHAQYEDFNNAPTAIPAPAVCNPGNGGGVQLPGPRTGGNVNCVIDAKGLQLPNAPKVTLSLTAAYVLPTTAGDFGVSTTLAHSSTAPFEIDGRLRQIPLNLLSGQLSWTTNDKRYSLKLWGKNLLNEHYFYEETSSLGDSGTLSPPRTYGVTVQAHF